MSVHEDTICYSMVQNIRYDQPFCDGFFCCCFVAVFRTSSAFSGELIHRGELKKDDNTNLQCSLMALAPKSLL